MRYFLKLAYNGKAFHGWQSQPNAESVQSAIERAMSTIMRRDISIVGAGRTDTGVHARRMYAHFDTPEEIKDKNNFLLSLNSLIGKDIVFYDIIKVEEDAHARFDATQREYKYFISNSKDPFIKDYFWRTHSNLNLQAMNEAAQMLLETEDFTSFAKLHSDAKTNICRVSKAVWKPIEEDPEAFEFLGGMNNGFVFTISADRFLRNMVRAVVGTLVEVGRNKMNLDGFSKVISRKDRCCAGTSMPANALFLWDITYPFIS